MKQKGHVVVRAEANMGVIVKGESTHTSAVSERTVHAIQRSHVNRGGPVPSISSVGYGMSYDP